ncbi:hypothetical protein H6F93_09485 [Leptolyngbya sp. FACHB-671]|uniref:hypothetical protein n=1 Tax=Leptolyngbya sp. FACHB-671 TaxID=2692812 RepID=UPI0016888BE2|nr:hypothetical protein [Leptolyngbya sp. FACHB-671]MBD2067758.1 hypothetical protein [Leptolyngbya sp. FACHB-671]
MQLVFIVAAPGSMTRGCRSAYRLYDLPTDRFSGIGFRVCCSGFSILLQPAIAGQNWQVGSYQACYSEAQTHSGDIHRGIQK